MPPPPSTKRPIIIFSSMMMMIVLLLLTITTMIVATASDPIFNVEWSAYAKPQTDHTSMTVYVKAEYSYIGTGAPIDYLNAYLDFRPLLTPSSTDYLIKYYCGSQEMTDTDIQSTLSIPFVDTTYPFPASVSHIICTFIIPSFSRIPFRFLMRTQYETMGSLYNFPGISPLTNKIEPMIQIRSATPFGDIATTSRIIGYQVDFPEELLKQVYFFYIPVNSRALVPKRYSDPNFHLIDTTTLSLHAWTPDQTDILLDSDLHPSTNSIYPSFTLEVDPNKISWPPLSNLGIDQEDVTTITPLLSNSQDDYSMTVTYDLSSALRSNTGNSIAPNIAGALLESQSKLKIFFPYSKIYSYFNAPTCTYTRRSSDIVIVSPLTTPDFIFDGRNFIGTGEEYYIVKLQCIFTLTSNSRRSELLADSDITNIMIDTNQFSIQIELIPYDINKKSSFIVFGNKYSRQNWFKMLSGEDPGAYPDINFSLQQYQIDPKNTQGLLSVGTIILNQIGLGSKTHPNDPVNSLNHYIEYQFFHVFGDPNLPLGRHQIIYTTAHQDDRWGLCHLDSATGGSRQPLLSYNNYGPNGKIIEIGPQFDLPAMTFGTFLCQLYRKVNAQNSFLDPTLTQATMYIPSVQVLAPNVSPQNSPEEGQDPTIYPPFIPTPQLSLNNPEDTIDDVRTSFNLGLPLLNWDDITANLYTYFDTNIDGLNFNQSPPYIGYQYLYKNVISTPTIIGRNFDFTINNNNNGCGITTITNQNSSNLSFLELIFPIKPSTLPIINDEIKKCTLQFTVTFNNFPVTTGHSYESIFPVWKSLLQSPPNKKAPFYGFTINQSPTVYPFPSLTHPPNPNPPALSITPLSTIKLHICYPQIITSTSLTYISLFGFKTSLSSITNIPEGNRVIFLGLDPSPNFRNALFNSCLNGFSPKLSYGGPYFDQFIGDFVHFGLRIGKESQTVPFSDDDYDANSTTFLTSPKFLLNPPNTLLNNVDILIHQDLIQYKPQSGPIVQIIKPNLNAIDISFNLGPEVDGVRFKNLQISFQIPIWISINILDPLIPRCITSNQPPRYFSLVPVSRTILLSQNPDISTVLLSIRDFTFISGPVTITCSIDIDYNDSTSTLPINPSIIIPITPIIVSFQDTRTTPPLPYSSTLSQSNNNMVFIYPNAKKLFCPTDTNIYAPCTYQDQPVIKPPPSITVPPPIITKLPITTRGLSGLCDIVVSNRDIVEIYNDSIHRDMCSIPIAGMVTTRTISRTELTTVLIPSNSISLLPSNQNEFILCDCTCKGYWHDDILNLDQKKCSKCLVPECPELLTPNNECTGCECTTEKCKRFRTYIFSTMYITPEVLRHFIVSEGKNEQILYNSIKLSTIELNEYLLSPSESKKSLYFSIMSLFSQSLTEYIKDRDIDDPFNTSSLESITITPLVEGSFTVWKLTFSIINTSQKPISSLAPLYGLPLFNSPIGQLFSSFYNNQYLNLNPITYPPQSEFALGITTPILSTEYSSSLKFFISDEINTGCLSRENAIKLESTNTPATIDMLHPCPLPNQYTPIHNDPEKTDLLNPLWSACSTSSSSSFSPSMEFTEYESLLQSTVSTISISIRQIYPRCIDFAGVDVGLLNVPCQIDPTSIIYSTTSSTLLLPIYTQTLLSSFSTDTLDLPIKQRISNLKKIILPKFPSFPQLTIVPCPIIEILPPGTKPKKPKKNSIPESDRCPVGRYGDKCQLENTIEQTSMFMSPTNLSTQSHSHIQWEYQGDSTQELTLVLQSNTKTNTGSGYFAWSQLLGTVPVASLYASAQIPTIDQSKLFQYVYDSIADGNTDMTDIYDQSTQVIIRGYFTRAANITISLDPDQITQNFTFELPMLCTDFNVQCRDSVSQFCHQSDGRCRCKPGYYNPNPDKQRRANYVVEDTGTALHNFDGDDLSCLPICQNDGDWVTTTQSCTCQPGFSGVNCEVSNQCQQPQKDLCAFGSNTISSDPISLGPQIANGYVQFAESKCQDSCTCYGKWTDSIIPSPSDSRSCSTCPLKPISRELYHADSLDVIKNAYLDSAELAPHYSPDRDEKYTQIYQPTVDSVTTHHDLTRQRCYITGTQNKTWEYGQCSQCLCHRGYGGDYCQLHIAYANITYSPGVNNKYHYDGITEILLFDKIVEELSLSMNNFNKNDLFIVKHNTNSHWIEVGFYTGLDFFIRNAELASGANVHQEFKQEKSPSITEESSSFSILSQYLSPLSSAFQFQPLSNVNTWNQPPITFNSQLPSNLDNLYTQWGQLQGNLPTAPIVHQDSGSFLGEITLPEPIQDPVCFDQGLLGCSGDPPKRASSTALIIGLVVGLLCAALLFLILVLVLRWCKKNERGFWKSHEQQDRDEMSNFVPSKRNEFTGSTAAPSMTVGTLSIMPLTTDGVEMTNIGASATSPKSSVQSVNNHTEVKDPTLPPEYKAYKDAKGNVFYINSETMTTSWTHPNEVGKDKEGGGVDYGSGW